MVIPDKDKGVPGIDTRDLIVQKAEELFAARGYDGVSIRDIARACGISNAALYYHFDSKEALVAETWRATLYSARQALLNAFKEDAGLRKNLTNLCIAYMRELLKKRSMIQATLHGVEGLGPATIEFLDQYHKQIVGLVAEKTRQGLASDDFRKVNADIVAVVLLGTLNNLIGQKIISGEDAREDDIVPPIIELLFEGIQKRN